MYSADIKNKTNQRDKHERLRRVGVRVGVECQRERVGREPESGWGRREGWEGRRARARGERGSGGTPKSKERTMGLLSDEGTVLPVRFFRPVIARTWH